MTALHGARRRGAVALRRSRRALVVASGLAAALVITELPVHELLAQRRDLSVVDRQLAAIGAENASLASEDAQLRQPSTVAAIAHADYGLVRPGQLSYVILPAAGERFPAGAGGTSLGKVSIARSQLVAGSAAALTGIGVSGVPETAQAGPAGAAGTGAGDFLRRTLQRLEFWRWAF